MVKYKVNLKFKDTDKSLNEIIIEVLKIEIKKQMMMTDNSLEVDLPNNCIYYSQNNRGYN